MFVLRNITSLVIDKNKKKEYICMLKLKEYIIIILHLLPSISKYYKNALTVFNIISCYVL